MRHFAITAIIAVLALNCISPVGVRRSAEKQAIIRLKTVPVDCIVTSSGNDILVQTAASRWMEIRVSGGKQRVDVTHGNVTLHFEVEATMASNTYVIANFWSRKVYAGTTLSQLDSLPCQIRIEQPGAKSQLVIDPLCVQELVDSMRVRDSLMQPEESPDDADTPFLIDEPCPEIIQEGEPTYPPEAKQAGIEGTVWVRVLIDTLGDVACAQVAKSSGSRLLDSSVVVAVHKNKYKPLIQNGRSVGCWVTYSVKFSLDR